MFFLCYLQCALDDEHKDYLFRYDSNTSMGQTGLDRQTITDHEDVLINVEKAFCERQYLYVLRQIIKITLTFIETLGYHSI